MTIGRLGIRKRWESYHKAEHWSWGPNERWLVLRCRYFGPFAWASFPTWVQTSPEARGRELKDVPS